MRRALKIRLYPTKKQQDSLNFQFGATRWIYNNSLAHRKNIWDSEQKSVSKNDLMKRLVELKSDESTAWLKDADSQALQQSIHNLDKAYRNFFAHRGRFPKFKSRHGKQSIAYPQRVRVNGNLVYLPKVGWVKSIVHRPIDGDIKTVTVTKTPTGKFYASILVEDGQEEPAKPNQVEAAIGIDLGLNSFAVTTAGDKIGNPRHLRKAEKALKRHQRSLSGRQKGSANRAKARKRVALAHERVANARADFQHKESRRLVDENQAICLETLKVKNMMKNKRLSKSIADAAWKSFTSKLSYKADWAGRHVVFIDQFHPSSKTCSICGVVQKSMTLSVRSWICDECDAHHDRDENAAQNILRQGVHQLRSAGIAVRGLSQTPVETT